mgnify:CR=1 FL=1
MRFDHIQNHPVFTTPFYLWAADQCCITVLMFEFPPLLSWTQCRQLMQKPFSRGWYSKYHWHRSKTMSEPRLNPEALQSLWEAVWTKSYVLNKAVNGLTDENQWAREVYQLCYTGTVFSKGYHDLHSQKPFRNPRTSGIQNYHRAWLILQSVLKSVYELSQCKNNPV